MGTLDLKRKELELARVKLATQDLEFKIEERLEEIERLREHVKVQQETEKRLIQEIKTFTTK